MPEESKRPLKVFLCHASQDKPAVRELYRRLVHDGVDVWLDETNLLPGMDWQLEIPRAVRNADAIVICLSNQSVTKEGYVQKEIRFALDVADEKPDGTIYLIPVRLDACEIPYRLARWQWVDLFSSDGYRKLRISLRLRADSLGVTLHSANRKSETEYLPAQDSSKQSKADLVDKPTVGRMFAVLTFVIVACAGIFWLGKWMSNRISQLPSPTVMPSASSTLEIPSATQLDIPVLIFPSETPTATFFAPLPVTDIPTQTALPVFTLAPSATALPVPPMVFIPAGSFLMGRGDGDPDEKPAHTVYIDAFYIDQFEVTNLMYSHCAGSGTCRKPVVENSKAPRNYYSPDYAGYPVIHVSWEMAKTYCEWRGARLPTEAEWEKAARGGLAEMLYPWGNESPICEAGARNGARFSGCSEIGTVKVGSFSANGYQIFDMTGNVWEWVFDWYRSDYYSQSPANSPNPQGPSSGEAKVVRGGSWSDTNIYVANRGFAPPGTEDDEIGFRCVMNATP